MRNRPRTPFFIALLVSLLLFSYFVYQSYDSYRSYKIAQSSDKYISFLYRCDNLLKNLEKERLISATYMGKNGSLDFKNIKDIRESTDISLQKAKTFIDKRPNFSKDLQYVRSRVDVISDDHNSILFKYYQDELSAPIIKQIELYTKELAFGISGIKNNLLTYKELILHRNKLNQKDSFITYILAHQTKLGNDDLKILDKYIKEEKSPLGDTTKDDFNANIKVIQGAITGEYNLFTDEWKSHSDAKSDRVDARKKEIFLDTQSTLKTVVTDPKSLMYNVLAAVVFLILSILFLRKILDSKGRKVVRERVVTVEKKREKPIKKSEPEIIISQEVESDNDDIVLKYNSKDLPLTNGIESQKVELKKTTIRSFDPMQTFTSVVAYFIQECEKKDIGFKYKIDPDIPAQGIGNVSKIDEVFKLFVEYILDSTTHENLIIFDIENIAQTKVESAIKLSLFRNSDVVKTDKSINLTKIKKILSIIDGTFELEEVEGGRVFHITINIKRN